MALKDHKPAFESENDADTGTATMTDTATAAPSTVQGTAAMTETATLPAVAKNTAVAAPAPKKTFKMAFDEQKDAFPLEAVIGLSMAAPRIKGEQGACYIADKSLGDKVRMSVESWNIRHLISSGLDSKDPGYQESIEYLATSYDGETVEGKGQTIDEYVAYLKSIGYTKARASKYGDIWGMVSWTAKDGDVAPEQQTLHLLQASQTSLGNFMAFCTTQGLLRSKGIGVASEELEVHAVARSKGNNKYTNFDFVVPKK